MTKQGQLHELITEMAHEDIESTLSVLTGNFVGLYAAYAEMRGNDSKKTINIESGDGQRKITIHALD